MTDWVNGLPVCLAFFIGGIPTIIIGFYLLQCNYQWKRRGE